MQTSLLDLDTCTKIDKYIEDKQLHDVCFCFHVRDSWKILLWVWFVCIRIINRVCRCLYCLLLPQNFKSYLCVKSFECVSSIYVHLSSNKKYSSTKIGREFLFHKESQNEKTHVWISEICGQPFSQWLASQTWGTNRLAKKVPDYVLIPICDFKLK